MMFWGCSETDPANQLRSTTIAIEPGQIYAEVIVPAGQSAISGGGRQFLPYPANWTRIIDGDSDQRKDLNGLVISDALGKGSVLAVKPVALLQLDSAGISKDVIIAIPVDSTLRTVEIGGFVDLLTEHEPVRHILQTWFVNHRGFGSFEFSGWRDEKAAVQKIRRQ